MKNAVLPPSKRSTVERQMDLVILFMFALLFAMCVANAACFAVWTQANASAAHLLDWLWLSQVCQSRCAYVMQLSLGSATVCSMSQNM